MKTILSTVVLVIAMSLSSGANADALNGTEDKSGARNGQTAQSIMSTRNSVRKWKQCYEQFGEAGLVPHGAGRPAETVTEALCSELLELIESKPQDNGYLSSRWTSQMLTEQPWERMNDKWGQIRLSV